jgi:hypothetical protein
VSAVIVENPTLGLALSFVGILVLVFVHLYVDRFRSLHEKAGIWISASAGVAIAYVFVDVLPLLAKQQSLLMDAETSGWLQFLKHHAYLVAMMGFAFHYAIALSTAGGARGGEAGDGLIESRLALRFSLISLLIYAFLIGYLIGEKWDHDYQPGLVFAMAMAIHFIGLNHIAYERAPSPYVGWLRFELAIVTVVGWLLAILTRVSDLIFFLLFSFLAGGIIVVAMSMELPRIRANSRDFFAFNAGLIGFAGLLLVAEYLRDLS